MTDPKSLLIFIELEWFSESWHGAGLTDDDLVGLQISLMKSPRAGDVIPGTKGVRKIRYAPKSWNTGKRSALRVLYVYFERYGQILLIFVYKKGKMSNLSETGKKAVNHAIERIEAEYRNQFGF
ncbi:MAG: hypothetical protein WD030_03470 [Pirellulales bacterium]